MANEYDIRSFGDDDLPRDLLDAIGDWAFIETTGGKLVLYIREGRECPAVLRECWAAYREIEPAAAPRVPRQRGPRLARSAMSAGLLAASCAEGAALLAKVNLLPGGVV